MKKRILFSAIIFDMDGLLLESESLARRTWKEAAFQFGFAMEDALLSSMVGRRLADSEKLCAEALGEHFPFAQVRALRLELAEEEMKEHGLPLRPGVEAVLAYVQQEGIPFAVATSTAEREAWERLERAKIKDAFSLLISGESVQEGKPAPDIFFRTAEALSCSPDKCIVFEDSEPGIFGAKRAGMIPILVPDSVVPSPEAREDAAFVLGSLQEALSLFERELVFTHSV